MSKNTLDNNTDSNLKSLSSLYVEGKWDELIDSLHKIKDKIPSGLYHYNLGTTLAAKGDVGVGRYHLEKATREGFYNNLVINNINVIKQDLPQVYETKVNKYLGSAREIPTDFYYASSLILLAMLLIYIFREKTIGRLRLFIFLILTILPTGFAFFGIANTQQAIVLSEAAVYEGPSKIYKQKNSISQGMKIIVEKNTDNWFFVKHPKAYMGWIDRELLGLL